MAEDKSLVDRLTDLSERAHYHPILTEDSKMIARAWYDPFGSEIYLVTEEKIIAFAGKTKGKWGHHSNVLPIILGFLMYNAAERSGDDVTYEYLLQNLGYKKNQVQRHVLTLRRRIPKRNLIRIISKVGYVLQPDIFEIAFLSNVEIEYFFNISKTP